jgi:hypothetical protein
MMALVFQTDGYYVVGRNGKQIEWCIHNFRIFTGKIQTDKLKLTKHGVKQT